MLRICRWSLDRQGRPGCRRDVRDFGLIWTWVFPDQWMPQPTTQFEGRASADEAGRAEQATCIDVAYLVAQRTRQVWNKRPLG